MGLRLIGAVVLSAALHTLVLGFGWTASVSMDRHVIGTGSAGGAIRARLVSRDTIATVSNPVPFNDWMETVGVVAPNFRSLDERARWTPWIFANGGNRKQTGDPAIGVHAIQEPPEFLKADLLDQKPVPMDDPDLFSLGPRVETLHPFRLRLYVDRDGIVQQIEVLDGASSDMEVIAHVQDLFSKVRFKPGMLQGQAVACYQDLLFVSEAAKTPILDMEPLATEK
jgi:hypothetical protein